MSPNSPECDNSLPTHRGAIATGPACLFALFGLATALAAPAPPSATETVRPGAGDDFRAAFATSQEIAEGKLLADANCARCHGAAGISTTKGVPHLAGQRAVYTHVELRAYKSGARGAGLMADAARFLSDEALVKVAAWYATLDPAAPAATPVQLPASGDPDPEVAGKKAAASCGGCHGESGVSRIPGMPSLVGLDPKYLIAATTAYKTGARKHDMMQALVRGLREEEVETIALYYARQKPGKAQTPAPGRPAVGKAAAAGCAACHGVGGAGDGMTPGLAGQDAQYFIAAMRSYRDGSRADAVMKGPASAVADATLPDLAAYYASLEPQAPKLGGSPLGTAEWVTRCDRCHGVNGNSTDPRIPALAAQRAEYLSRVLNAYRTGARRSSTMSAMAKVLTEAEVARLANHYSRQKARAVVYVQLPAAQRK